MIPLLRPTLPKIESIQSKLADIFKSGMLTNAKYVKEFEVRCAKSLGVKEVVALANGTSAIILSLKCLGIKGEVILPSFTFTSAAHSLLWCGIKPVFVDIDKETFNISPASIEKKITSRTTAIFPVHVFGNPCDIEKVQKIAQKHNLKIIYDGAHAFGSKYKGKSVACFGDATVFSLTPTKVLTTAEGGLIATRDSDFARVLRLGRNNGDSVDRGEEFLGITARMTEFSAILGIEGIKIFPENLKRRLKLVDLYKKLLSRIPGVSFQEVGLTSSSVFKDLTIIIDNKKFGFSRDELLRALLKKNIETKVYFYPPIHRKKAYKAYENTFLPNTDFISEHILNLPLYSQMPINHVETVCAVIKNLYEKRQK
ncbi:MAG: DegT/DnrJ/EryC1/StrS family aminotransferase [Candidatus Staskawiczbacteria bacterium]|jgi:dTDP-4-amino-4,6-dideoxygalactose transaminase